MQADLKRFIRLFRGNKRSFGQWFPDNGRMKTEKIEVPPESYEGHLRGKTGVGIVPVMDNSRCYFGAIDIDAHGADESIDLVSLSNKVNQQDLPLIVCRSKSGGAHVYLFCREALPAEDVRTALTNWAVQLGYPGVEIFPKQSKLRRTGDGDRPLGNWINLPYFNVAKTDRYMVEDGKPRDFDYFLSRAETAAISEDQLKAYVSGEHADSPPCVQTLLSRPIETYRNESLFAIGVYYRKRWPEEWRDMLADTNLDRDQLIESLPTSEVRKIADSIRKKDYGYRCAQQPCRDLCDRDACLKRKYGITPEEAQLDNILNVQQLIKIDTRPATYYLIIDGHKIMVDSVELLLSPQRLRALLVENNDVFIPPIPKKDHEIMMHRLFETMETIEAPEEAGEYGQLVEAIQQYFDRTPLDVDYSDPAQRMSILSGNPITHTDQQGNRYYAFTSRGLRQYLKRTRDIDVPSPQKLFQAVNKAWNIKVQKLDVGNLDKSKRPKVWMVPIPEDAGTVNHEPQEYEDEF